MAPEDPNGTPPASRDPAHTHSTPPHPTHSRALSGRSSRGENSLSTSRKGRLRGGSPGPGPGGSWKANWIPSLARAEDEVGG